jgi:4-hydroxy-3-methylbut-2-en-1-yl diphosphate synthase IspG/GcpE
MNLSVAAGWAAILGTYQTNMGTYMAYNDGAATATITTADPSNPRIDVVCITVSDAAYSGSLNQVAINVVKGTAASSPTVPSTPTNSIALAQVAVAAGATTISSGNITDVRVRAQIIEPTISSAAASAVPLRVVLNSGQTANALQILNSSGSVLNGFDANGNLLAGAVNVTSLEYEFIMGAY